MLSSVVPFSVASDIDSDRPVVFRKDTFKSWMQINIYLGCDYTIPVCGDAISIRPAGRDFTLQLHGEISSWLGETIFYLPFV